MSLTLKEDEKLVEGLRRIVAEELDSALHELDAGKPRNRGKAVHESRKRLKELRATLRLARPGLGDRWFDEENARLRDLGRPLSAVRDAQVMVEALAELKDHFQEELAKDAFAAVRQVLLRRRRATERQTVVDGAALAKSARGLAEAQQRAANWPLAQLHWDDIAAGVGKVYRQGRAAMKAALEDGGDLPLHEWRKRAKDLRYQLTILQPLWPEVIGAMAEQAKQLGDYLGDDHDLAVLGELARGELHEQIPKHDRQALTGLIRRRRQSLQKHAEQLGRRLYAEKPKDFQRRIETYAAAGG